ALLRGTAQVAARRPDHTPDEQVEQDEEADLEQQQDLADSDGADRHGSSRSKTTSVDPSVTRSPSSSFACRSLRPFTSMPFVEPRSTIQYDVSSCRTSACLRETLGSDSWISQSCARPSTVTRFSIGWRSPSTVSHTVSRSTGA